MSLRRRSAPRVAALVAAVGVALAVAPSAVGAPPPAPTPPEATYRVLGADTAAERTALAARGVDVLSARPDAVEVRTGPEQAERLRAEGLVLEPLAETAPVEAAPVEAAPTETAPTETGAEADIARLAAFPAGYTGYTSYDELGSRLAALRASNPAIVSVSTYGTSYQGRSLPLVKISDSVGVDEAEPEVLFTCAQHAREHLTVEMCLRIAERLVAGYSSGGTRGTVDSREIWLMPMVNPDGAEYDTATGSFAYWRKNRQPNAGTSAVGTDPNRNWGHRWGCCGGSSGSPSSDTYRGPSAFSAPETARVRDWVAGRVVGGRQQITTHVDWHSYGELVLWPYGYTRADTAAGLDAAAESTFRQLSQAVAATNGYTAEQASDLYITDGGIDDWMWAAHRIWSLTVEMYPRSSSAGGFYPPDSVIAREVARNDATVDLLLRYADCPPRISGRSC